MRLDARDREKPYREYDNWNLPRTARVNLVGWSINQPMPKFPNDDKNVSKRATPESKGACPGRHCGSGKHWDNECKHAFKGNRAASANLASASSEDYEAQKECDELYYVLGSEEETTT